MNRDPAHRNSGRPIVIAERAGLPLLTCTPTWRANRERVFESGISRTLNEDAVEFLRHVRGECSARPECVPIGGRVGCKNDCYQPSEGLAENEAEGFHGWQIDRLASAGCAFLNPDGLGASARSRLVGFQANASSRNHSDLDGSDDLSLVRSRGC